MNLQEKLAKAHAPGVPSVHDAHLISSVDVLQTLLQRECDTLPTPDYCQAVQCEVKAPMRRVVVDWMDDVSVCLSVYPSLSIYPSIRLQCT